MRLRAHEEGNRGSRAPGTAETLHTCQNEETTKTIFLGRRAKHETFFSTRGRTVLLASGFGHCSHDLQGEADCSGKYPRHTLPGTLAPWHPGTLGCWGAAEPVGALQAAFCQIGALQLNGKFLAAASDRRNGLRSLDKLIAMFGSMKTCPMRNATCSRRALLLSIPVYLSYLK
ncbi:hypothetical protein EV356DRAFT_512134 [Viridothelium virens]|uniref:Uncharacterized protein n=1 Tax=Viridothelium virens TaxID=1048519 RepID=A0A6A6GSW4_VIRVR|nr:hypothetical protein EV356DRAFT_512134 [Viridothelium virens]